MAKERKCKKCGLTYKGMKTTCPYCHRKTKYGVLNTIMAVIGYITTISVAGFIIWFEITEMMIMSFALLPILMILICIAIVVAIIIAIVK